MTRVFLAAVVVLALAGCQSDERAAAPPPQEIGEASVGHFCGMRLGEHPGPKGQVFLKSRPDTPIWFTSVRDAVAFTHLPEEPKDVVALYVNDMGRAHDWDHPEPGTWVEAREAWFVLGSRRAGGMGAPEAVPFSQRDAAQAFAEANGGRLARFTEIPRDYVLGPEGGPTP